MFEHGIIGHDPQLARSILGSFNRCLRWITLAYLVAVVAIHSVPGPLEPVRLAGPLLVLATSFLFQNLLPRGRIHAASILMLVVVYLAMLPRLLSQGVASSASFLVLASIPLSALLFGMKVGIGYAILDFATLAVFLLLEPSGRVAVDTAADPFSWAAIAIVVAVVVLVYQSIAIDGQSSALDLADREREELERIIARAEQENRELEAEVKSRTEGLSEANEATTRLSASLSHDLRAPLRSIVGFAKALSEEDVPDSVKIQLQGIVSDAKSLDLVLERTMQNLQRETRR